MRITFAVALLVLWGSVSAEETNLFTFTDLKGNGYTNVHIRKLDTGIVWTKSGLGGGFICVTNLPAELCRKLGIDIRTAEIEYRLQLERKRVKDAREAAQQARVEAAANRMNALMATRVSVNGKVVQKISSGLLVDSGSEARRRYSQEKVSFGIPGSGRLLGSKSHGVQTYFGMCLVTDYPAYATTVPGDIVDCLVFPNGEYSYTAVNNAERTVRRFTCNASMVQNIASDEEMRTIRANVP